MNSKDLRNIASVYEAVYGGAKKEEKKPTDMVVTNADKKANTKAYQNLKAGVKGYKAADHLGEGIKGEDNETRKAAAAERKAGVKTRLSPSEGRANVANMLYKIRNAKSNPQNESVNEGKKADKDYDGDGKIESGTDEYMGSKDKAIKKALGKEVEDLQKAAETGKGKYVAKADKVKGVGESRWWDVSKEDMIEGYGKGVKMADLPKGSKVGSKKVAAPKGSKMKKGHDCASKVKHEEYGFGDCIKEMHTLDEEGNVTHYDVMFLSLIHI